MILQWLLIIYTFLPTILTKLVIPVTPNGYELSLKSAPSNLTIIVAGDEHLELSACSLGVQFVKRKLFIDCDCLYKLSLLTSDVIKITNIGDLNTTLAEFQIQTFNLSINVVADSLFSPVRVTVKGPICPKHFLLLDYHPFEVFPGRRSHWERLSRFHIQNSSMVLGCENFLHKGVYRISLDGFKVFRELSLNTSTTVPQVHFREDSIFPHCSSDFPLTWNLPQCPLPPSVYTHFRIRILAVLDGPENVAEDWSYVDEFAVSSSNASSVLSMTTIPCSQFDIIYKKYCFELVAVNDVTHRVTEWDRRCVFTEPLHRVDGNWSQWGEWSPCSKSCGDNGVEKRVRTCTEPPPNRGRFCDGAALETKNCTLGNCTEEDSKTMMAAALLSVSNKTDSCNCGCKLYEQQAILYTSSHLNCANGTMLWEIPQNKDAHVSLQVLVERSFDWDVLKILKGKANEILWSSESSKSRFTVNTDLSDNVFVYYHRHDINVNDGKRPMSVFYISYKVTHNPSRFIAISKEKLSHLNLAWAFGYCTSNLCQNVIVFVLLVFVGLVILSLIAIPPLFCTYATKKFVLRRNVNCSSQASEALLNSLTHRLESEMFRSNGTDSTHLESSTPPDGQQVFSVAKRSIGIQLSVHSSPRTLRSPTRQSFMNSLEELEYDYYDPIVPGSLLRPCLNSEIDIDCIIKMETSGWLSSPAVRSSDDSLSQTHDVTTQVDTV